MMKQGKNFNLYKDEKNGMVLETYDGLINYKDENGTWKKINPVLKREGRNYYVDNAPYKLVFNSRMSEYTIYPNRNDKSKYIEFFMPDIYTIVSSKNGGITTDLFYRTPYITNNDIIHWNFTGFEIKVKPCNSQICFEYIIKNQFQNHEIRMKINPVGYKITPNGKIVGTNLKIVNLIHDAEKRLPIISYYDSYNQEIVVKLDQERITDAVDIQYPITLDPTLTFYSSNYDAFVYNSSASNYWISRNGTTADFLVNYLTYNSVGQANFPANGIFNETYRSFIYFDTSSIPDGCTITKANLSLYGYSDFSISSEFSVTAQMNLSGDHPQEPPLVDDYWMYHYNNTSTGKLIDMGYFDTTPGFSTTSYNNISLNLSGRENLSRFDLTKFCLRSSNDINGVVLAAFDFQYVNFFNSRGPSDKIPKLTIWFNASEISNPYPADGATGVGRFTNHSITVNESRGYIMNITWQYYDVGIGDWYTFGTNSTVTNGTYRQENQSYYEYWSYEFQWKVCVNMTDEYGNIVWTNTTFTFTTINSSRPIITNINPVNQTMFSYGEEFSVSIEDPEGQFMIINFNIIQNCGSVFTNKFGYNDTYILDNEITTTGINYYEIIVTDYNSGVFTPDNRYIWGWGWFASDGLFYNCFCTIDKFFSDEKYTNEAAPVYLNDSSNPDIWFYQYFNNTVESGLHSSDYVINDTLHPLRFENSPHIFFINNSTGYAFEISDINNQLMTIKTTDGGVTWTELLTPDYYGAYDCACWWDGFTPGRYERQFIHVISIKSGSNHLEVIQYNRFDVTTDEWDFDDWVDIYKLGNYPIAGSIPKPSVIVTTDRYLVLSAFGGSVSTHPLGQHGVVLKSNEIVNDITDDGTTEWIDITPNRIATGKFDSANDRFELVPLRNGSFICVYYDHFDREINTTFWNLTTDDWNDTWIDLGYAFSPDYGCSLYKYTQNVYVTWIRVETFASQVYFNRFNADNNTWDTTKTTTIDVYGESADIICSEGNGDLYIIYSNSSTATDNQYHIECINSTDEGNTWSDPQTINHDGEKDYSFVSGNYMSNYKIFGSWFENTADAYWNGTVIRQYDYPKESFNETANVTSIKITLPDGGRWCQFNASYNTLNNGVNFSFLNETGEILVSDLDGNNNDLSFINTTNSSNRTISVFIQFNNTSFVHCWNITFFYLNTTITINPYTITWRPILLDVEGKDHWLQKYNNVTIYYRYSTDNITFTNWIPILLTSYPFQHNFNFPPSVYGYRYYEFYTSANTSNCGSGVSTEYYTGIDDSCYYYNQQSDIIKNNIVHSNKISLIIAITIVIIGLILILLKEGKLIFLRRKKKKERKKYVE